MKKSINVYVLKEYQDDYAYGEELIRVYSRKEDALSRLRQDVEDWAETDWNNVYCKMGMNDGDTFDPDYVSYTNNGVTCFFIIEKHEMAIPYEMMQNIADKVEHADNIEDARNLNDERDDRDKLSDAELNVAVERYEDGRDWNRSYAEQLASYMDSVVAERNLASNSADTDKRRRALKEFYFIGRQPTENGSDIFFFHGPASAYEVLTNERIQFDKDYDPLTALNVVMPEKQIAIAIVGKFAVWKNISLSDDEINTLFMHAPECDIVDLN